ncbi:MAG: S8 family serine peptidase [candidate division Zixibacteria bacterium]|nr:S8 family serine peptidase [candidate division Zixibacteria bacterium]
MKKFLITVFLVVAMMGLLRIASAGEIDTGLEQILQSSESNQQISALVYLNEQVNLKAITQQMDMQSATLSDRHETVVRALQDVADRTQNDFIMHLDDLKSEGRISDYHAYWITNAFRIDAAPSEIKMLADHPDVEIVYFNYEIELIEPVDIKESSPSDIASVEIGVEAVNAPDVWALGFTGEGVLVANMDTGVQGDHPALEDRWAGVADPRYAGHPEWAWYDPYLGQNNFPYDDGGHGTHTMGSVTGADDATGDTIGVAPGAYWMASAPIDRGGGIPGTVADAILSFEWMVDPDGDPGTNWDVPDVCSNSWGVTTGHGYPPCDTLFWSYLDACEAAGTVILFSAGNEGSSGLRRPSDRATDDYRTCAVAAVDANQSGWPVASFSSRGPTYCTPGGEAAIKPDISAPGVDVRSAYPGSGYTTMSGTSMASPHVNGVVALIRQANPNLSVELVKQIIYDTAYDLGSSGEDNDYGWGMIDAYAAVQVALSYLDGYGVISGRVTDLVSGSGLPGQVSVTNRVPEIKANCNQEGYYNLYVPSDSIWDLRAEYTSDYLPSFSSVSVTENDTVFQDFSLEPKVEVILKASFGNPAEVSYRTFYFRGSWDDDGFYDAGWPSSFFPMKDDGVRPDEIAGDGVFTGSMKLATDLDNTYSWAVYAENYGGESSILQNGDDFDITDPADPPTVSTVRVNPTGSENNWTLSVEDISGLEFDLTPGYDGNPDVWSGSISIPGGYTSQYHVKVMRSDNIFYGDGGIGGARIDFAPTATGVYTFYFNDSNDIVSTGADLIALPDWLDVITVEGASETREITLENNGELDVNFGINTEVGDYLAGSRQPLPEPEPYTSYIYDGPKTMSNDNGQDNPPVTTGSGGPDNFGYRWIDSDEPGGPTYQWVDITNRGTQITMSDDDNQGPFALPFDVNFYENTFNGIRICSNGFISFTSTATSYSNYEIPSTSTPENFIAPLWDDLNPSTGGEVWYYINSDSAIVSWINVPHYYADGSYTFQIILLRSGTIIYNYANMDYDVTSATVGIQNATQDDGLEVVYNAAYLHNDLAVKISAGWLDVAPGTGVIPAGGSLPLSAIMDASNLTLGDYDGTITITSWDAVRTLPEIQIPVDLRVVGIMSEMNITMRPNNPPVQIPAGGYFDFTIAVTENLYSGRSYDGWTMVGLPGGGFLGPLVQGSMNIGSHETQYFFPRQWVPGNGVPGNYTYHAYIGDYPSIIIDQAEFPFEITSLTLEGGSSDWNITGFSPDAIYREPFGNQLPTEYTLSQNYPNPFNAQSVIKYTLPQGGKVELSVFNILGQNVETLVNGYQDAGYKSVTWDASSYSSGIYFYKLNVNNIELSKRMTLIK